MRAGRALGWALFLSIVRNCLTQPCAAGTTGPDGGTCTACPSGSTSTQGRGDVSFCHCAAGTSAPISATLEGNAYWRTGVVGTYYYNLEYAGRHSFHRGNYFKLYFRDWYWGISDNVGSSSLFFINTNTNGNAIDLHNVLGWQEWTDRWQRSDNLKFRMTQTVTDCTACVPGKYAERGSHLCHSCPSNSGPLTRQKSINDCLCNIGYTGPTGGTCTVCSAGKYKTATGSALCTDCGAGKFSTTLGASAESSCVICGANSISLAGSSGSGSCWCSPGMCVVCLLCARALPRLVLPRLATSCHALPRLATSCHALPRLATPCHTVTERGD
jgi:hypothetical protein